MRCAKRKGLAERRAERGCDWPAIRRASANSKDATVELYRSPQHLRCTELLLDTPPCGMSIRPAGLGALQQRTDGARQRTSITRRNGRSSFAMLGNEGNARIEGGVYHRKPAQHSLELNDTECFTPRHRWEDEQIGSVVI